MKPITAKSAQAKKALAGWLNKHDTETLEMLQGLASDYGPFQEVSYRNLNPAMQSDLIGALRSIQQASAAKKLGEMKGKLKWQT